MGESLRQVICGFCVLPSLPWWCPGARLAPASICIDATVHLRQSILPKSCTGGVLVLCWQRAGSAPARHWHSRGTSQILVWYRLGSDPGPGASKSDCCSWPNRELRLRAGGAGVGWGVVGWGVGRGGGGHLCRVYHVMFCCIVLEVVSVLCWRVLCCVVLCGCAVLRCVVLLSLVVYCIIQSCGVLCCAVMGGIVEVEVEAQAE